MSEKNSGKRQITIYCCVDGTETPLLKIECDEFDFTSFHHFSDDQSFSINGANFEISDKNVRISRIVPG